MSDKIDITGIILAGGKSKRMGTDKGFILWNQKPFVQHSIDALRPLVGEIIIVSDHAQYDALGYKRVPDSLPAAGPLTGLYTGLNESVTELNLVLSCDVPLIKTEILEKLISAYDESVAAAICSADERIMPLVGLYHKSIVEICKSLLEEGERRMMKLLDRLSNINYVVLNNEETKSVRNINSPKDLIEIENEN